MSKLNEYRVAYRGLKEGIHVYNYTLDASFFNCFDATKGVDAKINARVEITKSALLLKVKMEERGVVKTICDRCLEPFDLQVEGKMELFVKQGERESGNEDDYIVLAAEDDFLELGTYLYEIYMLNYPVRAVHDDGKCKMDNIMEKYIIVDNKPTDPRWDELKKLINN